MKDFVVVAQDVQYTQYRGRGELRAFFDGLMDQVYNFNGRQPGATRQGFYAFSADGHLYGAMNARSTRRLLRMLNHTRAEFAKDARPRLSFEKSVTPVPPAIPAGTAVLRSLSRIHPIPESTDRRNRALGRDFLWILPSELSALQRGEIPQALVARWVRFHLTDNIRGEPDPWEPEHVQRAHFEGEVERFEQATVVTIAGEFSLLAPPREHLPETGYVGDVAGEIRFGAEGELVAFDLLASGMAWGRSRYTNGAPEGRFPLQIGFTLSRDPRLRQIPPGMYFRGAQQYWNPTMRSPNDPAKRP